jgi:hypothetical protein
LEAGYIVARGAGRGGAQSAFKGCSPRILGQEPGQHLVAERGGPEQAALVAIFRLIVLA